MYKKNRCLREAEIDSSTKFLCAGIKQITVCASRFLKKGRSRIDSHDFHRSFATRISDELTSTAQNVGRVVNDKWALDKIYCGTKLIRVWLNGFRYFSKNFMLLLLLSRTHLATHHQWHRSKPLFIFAASRLKRSEREKKNLQFVFSSSGPGPAMSGAAQVSLHLLLLSPLYPPPPLLSSW